MNDYLKIRESHLPIPVLGILLLFGFPFTTTELPRRTKVGYVEFLGNVVGVDEVLIFFILPFGFLFLFLFLGSLLLLEFFALSAAQFWLVCVLLSILLFFLFLLFLFLLFFFF